MWWHLAVQASPPKELANQAEAACPLLGEGQMTGTDQPMQERQARRALEERDQGRIGIEGRFPLQPVLECRTGDTHLLGKGALAGGAGLELEDQLGHLTTRPPWRGLVTVNGRECRGIIQMHGSLPMRVMVPYQHEQATRARLSQRVLSNVDTLPQTAETMIEAGRQTHDTNPYRRYNLKCNDPAG